MKIKNLIVTIGVVTGLVTTSVFAGVGLQATATATATGLGKVRCPVPHVQGVGGVGDVGGVGYFNKVPY